MKLQKINIHFVYFSDSLNGGTATQPEQGRYDQLMVAPNGNPYVLSPQTSSVPNPQANPITTQSVSVSSIIIVVYI